jgi:thiol-disulfide isomerase/thioredoxin
MISGSTRRGLLGGGVALAAAAAGIGAYWYNKAARQAGERLDDAFWGQRFERPEGGEVALADLRGKPLLVNFWATWCPPCIEEMPMIDAFFRENGVNGWQVIGLAVDRPGPVRRFLDRTPVSYPVGLAGSQGYELIQRLGDTEQGLPFTIVIDGAGSVMARKIGRLNPDDLQRWRGALDHG